MIRPWPNQRKTRFKNRRRAPVEKRYIPKPRFLKNTYWYPLSDFAYLLAKGVYWRTRYGEPYVSDCKFSLQG